MPTKFPKELIDRIIADCRVEDVAKALMTLKPKGKDLFGRCPGCGKDHKLSISPAKQTVKCFSCGTKGWNQKTIIAMVAAIRGCDRNEAITWLTDHLNLHHLLSTPEVSIAKGIDKKPSAAKAPKATSVRQMPEAEADSFRDRSIRESGITEAMQRLDLVVQEKGKQPYEVENFDRYTKGTINYRKDWRMADGVDMLMHYVGLDRKRMTFDPKKGTKDLPMFRCRFQSPEAHVFKGKARKYLGPPESGLHLWLPSKLITDYNRPNTRARVLTIQEGEKKADRICQVVPSVGVNGIHGLANVHSSLPQEFELIMEHFGTDTIIFFMDADLFDLGTSVNESVDHRPKTFASAAKKFRQHFHKLQSDNRRLNILLAHPTTLDRGIKGMDDLMSSGLMGNDELAEAIENGIKGHDHEFIKFYDLTTLTDEKIDAIWHLNAGESGSYHKNFAHHYGDAIREKHEDTFLLGRMEYRFDAKGQLELAQPLKPEEQFYEVETNAKTGAQRVIFSPTRLVIFLVNRGYFRYRERGNRREADTFSFIHVRNHKVTRLPVFDIRDFILEFIDENEPGWYMVRDHFRSNHESLLGAKIFSLLPFEEPKMLKDGRYHKVMPFNNGVWTITPKGVTVQKLEDLDGSIWEDTLVKESPEHMGEMFKLSKITNETIANCSDPKWKEVYQTNKGRHIIEITEAGRQCVYLQFLCNTGNFYWQEQQEGATWWDGLDADKAFETMQHLIAKLTAYGHLLRKFRIEDSDYDIFAMEGNLIEDNRSDGRSGKSLFGRMLAHVVPVADVDGKKDMAKDIYIWDKVTPETNFIVVDDAHPRLWDISKLYSRQTGSFGVRAMNTGEKQIPYEQAPHFYISSNWNLLANDHSTMDRWRTLVFSDYYSAKRKPQDIHEHLFYREWDDLEKSRFFSLLAGCCQSYFELSGVYQADPSRAKRRMWEAQIGRVLKEWYKITFVPAAEAEDGIALRTGYAIPKLVALGTKLDKKGPDGKLIDGCESWSFYGANPELKKWVKEPDFKKKLWMCTLVYDHIINPGKECTLKTDPYSEFHGVKTKDGIPYGGEDKSAGIEYVTIVGEGQMLLDDPAKLPAEDDLSKLPEDLEDYMKRDELGDDEFK